MIRYGISMGSLEGFMTPEIASAFRRSDMKIIELCIKSLELDDLQKGPSRKLIRELLVEKAIQVESLHLPFGKELDPSNTDEAKRKAVVRKLCELIEKNLEFGAKNINMHCSSEPLAQEERRAHIEQAKKSVCELLPVIKKHRLTLTIEFMPRSCIGNHETELLEIADAFPCRELGFCLDVNHLMGRHADLPLIVEKLGPRLMTLHLSDYDGIDEQHWFPGQGIIAWPVLMAALHKTKRKLVLFFETVRQLGGCDPIFNLRQAEGGVRFLERCCSCPIIQDRSES